MILRKADEPFLRVGEKGAKEQSKVGAFVIHRNINNKQRGEMSKQSEFQQQEPS